MHFYKSGQPAETNLQKRHRYLELSGSIWFSQVDTGAAGKQLWTDQRCRRPGSLARVFLITPAIQEKSFLYNNTAN